MLMCLASPLFGQGTRGDFERASSFRTRVRGQVSNLITSVEWINSDSLWYTLDLGEGRATFVTVDTATKTTRSLFDQATLATRLSVDRTVEPDRLPIDRLYVTAATIDAIVRDDASIHRLDRASGVWSAVELASLASHPFLLDAGTAHGTGASSAIIVVNTSDKAVSLFWLNDGARTPYGGVEAGATRRQHTFGGHRWAIVREDGSTAFEGPAANQPGIVLVERKSKELPANETAKEPAKEPSPTPRVRFEKGNVVLERDGVEKVLTKIEGDTGGRFTGPAHWSPDRERVVVWFRTPGKERLVHIIESSPADQTQPKLHTFAYPKPGDEVPVAVPRLIDVVNGVEIPIASDLFEHPRMIEHLAWAKDSFSFVYTKRGHSARRLVRISRDGVASTVTEDVPSTFVDVPNVSYFHRLAGTDEALWLSERDGWRHLYRVGREERQLTKGEFVVRGVEHVEEGGDTPFAILRVAGVHKDQDPYYIHYARVNLDGSGFTLLTSGNGTHEATFSPDRRFLIDRYSRVDMPEVVELRSAVTGALIAELARADDAKLRALPWTPPQPFVAKGRDGTTDIYGVIVRPTNFDASKRYPVIEHIYAGPHGAFVPKAFDPHLGVMHDMAELGFIVVQIDGMGTAHRSKAFHDVCYKNLMDAGFPDRIAWMRAAAAQHPEMDLTRVGIFGGSAGGQNALGALLHHGDFYKAAVADCGCHDNRVDKLWWNEAWMGWPVDESYERSSNVTHAHKLVGDLLLIVGELDRNVDPASTMQVVNALVKADKDFDLLVIPGTGHGAAETPYGRRRRADFFVRHLIGEEPRRAGEVDSTP
ncbi:MAG: prolyl oligopeptidase family serine peptidase [Phycisphaerales bacterium]